jgi:hypothetical protein
MKTIETYPIGSEVYYFNPTIHGDLEIKKSIVIGCFLHKSKGELYYTLLNEAVEAYAVRLTEKGAEEQRDRFEAVRKELLAQEEIHQERMTELWGEDRHEEFGIDNLPTEGALNGSDSEIPSLEQVHE